LTAVGALSLLVNASFALVHFRKIIQKRTFSFGGEVHADALSG
jgi:hypothetical protein